MLTYLHGSSDTLPDLIAERKAREDRDKART